MATSGSKSVAVTSWDTLKFSWTLSSQSVANNTSTVTWKLQLISTSSGKISSTASKTWSVTVNGTKYSGTNTVGIANNTTKTLASGTTTIAHNTDGTKEFSYSFSQEFNITFSGNEIGTIKGLGYGTLTTIPRKSTLSASNGTLGTAQTLTINRESSSFTHTIKYTCGSASGTIATKTSSASVSFTPPLSLASQNTTGTSVSIKFTITTYSGNTSVGSNTKTITCSIPSSVKPSCKISVSDAAGYSVFVKGYSKFKITVTPTLAYGSAIASYSVNANGTTYTTASVTTSVLSSSGTLTITATVKDKRGRTGTASINVDVYDKSTLKINNGTLGVSQELEVYRPYVNFKHTITYSCGSASGTICTKSSNPLIDFTPPKDLANQNTTGTNVSVKFTITTYCDDKNIGSSAKTITCTIPDTDEFRPILKINMKDTTGLDAIYGGLVKGMSKLGITLEATPAYGSQIVSYNTNVLGQKYTEEAFDVGVINTINDITISATATDQRGRKSTVQGIVVGILDYSPPLISSLTVGRCNENGTPNDTGEYVQVTFSASVSPIKTNYGAYTLRYKKTTENEYPSENIETFGNACLLNNQTYIFKADTGSSYDVLLSVSDKLSPTPTTRTTSASTAYVVMHFGADGKSVGIGKIAELSGVCDIGFKTMFSGGVKLIEPENNTDLNSLTKPNLYRLFSDNTYLNYPVQGFGAVLEVLSEGSSILQRITSISKNNFKIYARSYYSETWGEWQLVYTNSSEWHELTLESGVSIYKNDTPKYRVEGKQVDVKGKVGFTTKATSSGSSPLLFTLPSGCRPSSNTYCLVPLTGKAVARLLISTAGGVYVEWVYSFSNNAELFNTSISWLSVNFSFAI